MSAIFVQRRKRNSSGEKWGRGARRRVVRPSASLRREAPEEKVREVVGVDQAHKPVRVRPVVLGDDAARVGGARAGREQGTVGEVVDLPSLDELMQLRGQRVVGDLAGVGEDLNADPELNVFGEEGALQQHDQVGARFPRALAEFDLVSHAGEEIRAELARQVVPAEFGGEGVGNVPA